MARVTKSARSDPLATVCDQVRLVAPVAWEDVAVPLAVIARTSTQSLNAWSSNS